MKFLKINFNYKIAYRKAMEDQPQTLPLESNAKPTLENLAFLSQL